MVSNMLLTHEREKLINTIIFFAENTKHLHKTKLCKLLYFLDFEHYKETGRSVTGMDYFAWKMGPVPVEFFEEVDHPDADMAEKIDFSYKQISQGNMLLVNPLAKFDPTHFSKREMGILRNLATEFRDALAEDMVEATHLENQPWHKVYEVDGQHQSQIPYDLAIRKQEKSVMHGVVKEREAVVQHFSAV